MKTPLNHSLSTRDLASSEPSGTDQEWLSVPVAMNSAKGPT